MMKCLWLPALLLAALLDTTAAQAGPRICNDTDALHHLAVVLREGGSWVARGWQHLNPGECAEPAPDPYNGRFLYFRAESPGYRYRDDSVRFCTAPGRFRIPHGGGCTGENQVPLRFAKAAADQKVLLSARSAGGAGQAAAREKDPHHPHDLRTGGQHYTAEVTFQGCRLNPRKETATCQFIGDGIELAAQGRLQVSDPLFTYLLGLLRGTSLVIDGEMTSRFGAFGELDLHSVTPRVPGRLDKILHRMQGRWQSERRPLDRFIISGAVRRASYGGRQMTPEFLSVRSSCEGKARSEGEYLQAWDSQRGSSMCYRIEALTQDRLTLVYMPNGIRLDYRRIR
ncbi:DUF1036 domain-containing protein [Leisingera sp. S132]|uniref:DUF1036 domain-containing protein n=1 Tax=Leisingera sp. S132 TaxID=2867016 RepID=UPI0021A54FAD|nr:DUF1036 domain-containing protein [Leisingera sp. S132]UWQ77889.1 DUF1036 domain-containing protein [Leisingera sp. S132]